MRRVLKAWELNLPTGDFQQWKIKRERSERNDVQPSFLWYYKLIYIS